MIKMKHLIMENELRTQKGSSISRYKNLVGKRVGNDLYVHRQYAPEVISHDVISKALDMLVKIAPNFHYNAIRYDMTRGLLRFDEAPDFDTAREPHVGNYVVVDVIGKIPPRKGYSNFIWHHKWLWVKDDYKGFDVDKSKEWSRIWLSKLQEPAKGTDPTWNVQLQKYGLQEKKTSGYDIVFGGIRYPDFVVAYVAGPDSARIGHERNMGRNRWKYKEENGVVFWYMYPPSIQDKSIVTNWLENRHYIIKQHRPSMDEYKKITENKLLMEANTDEAALDFLKQKVRTGPYKGNVYLAGGAVRDMIRGEVPKDLDVVVTNYGMNGGMEFAIWLAKEMGNYKHESNPVLASKFGTAKVLLTGTHNGVDLSGYPVESVFARKEVYTPGSRKPEVFPGTIEDDAFRRDFTVNSLMMNLTTDEILDITGKGRIDIAAGLIRTTNNPDEIFGQDALRMFRAIRFATKYNWKIDPPTWEGIKNNLSNLSNTSYERVSMELDKILMTKDPAYGIRLLRDSGLLSHVSPELQQAVGMTQNKHHKHDVFDHTMEVLGKTNPVLVQRLMALFHDIGKVVTREETPTGVHFIGHENAGVDIVDRTMRKLKYPLELIDAVKLGVAQHMRLKHGKDEATMSDSVLRKFKIALGNHLEDTLDVIHADNLAHADASAMPNQINRVRERLKTLDIQVTKPNLPINGNDLIAMGIKPGPIMSKLLGAVTDAWYSNPNITRDEAIAIVKGML